MAYIDEVLADSPQIYLPLQENSGTSAIDSSPNGLNATYVNGVGLADGIDPSPLRSFGNHIRLDGSNDHLLLENSSWMMPSTGFTFEGVFYFRSWSNWMRIFDFANASSVNDMYFAANNTGAMQLYIGGVSFTFPRFAIGEWLHLVVTVTSAGAAIVYVNGNSYASGVVGVPTDGPRTFKYIGKSAYNDPYLAASVAHVSIYNTVLSPLRVKAHADAIVTRPQDMMAVSYMYSYVNNGQGVVAADQSGYFLAEVNMGQNSPAARTAFIETDAYVVARKFIGWGVPIRP
jgi:hypothetical protein